MKIEKIKIKKYKLLKLGIVKSKILKKEHYLNNITVENIEIRLKKALHAIYLYHVNRKRILFVGNPLNINSKITKLFKNTKHLFVPTSVWIAGAITNQNSSFKSLFRQKKNTTKVSLQLLDLKKKIDLIVVMDKELNQIPLNESYNSKLPIISLNNDLNMFENKTSYKIPGNFLHIKNKIKNSLVYSVIISVLKKANIVKYRFRRNFVKLNTISIIKRGKKNQYYKKNFFYNVSPEKKKI